MTTTTFFNKVEIKEVLGQAPPSGTIGTVTCVDDIGTIHMMWNNGSSLGLVPDDEFVIVKE